MADYTAQANAIYDPQQAADTATETAAYNATKASFGNETNAANTAYTQALAAAGTARDASSAKMDAVALSHGLFSSGLAANQQRLVYQDYQNNADKIATTRAQKLADIATRSTANDQGYQAKLAALSSKYQGEKANYVATHQNEDAKAAAAAAAAAQRQAASDARYNARQAAKAPTGYGITRDSTTGGMTFHGPNGMPISAGAYLNSISGGQAGGQDLANVLSTGSANDKKIAQDIIQNKLTDQAIQKKYPWLYQ